MGALLLGAQQNRLLLIVSCRIQPAVLPAASQAHAEPSLTFIRKPTGWPEQCSVCSVPASSAPAHPPPPATGAAPSAQGMPPGMGAQMGAMADMMRQNPAMAEQMRSMMQNMDPEQFKSMVRAWQLPDVALELL